MPSPKIGFYVSTHIHLAMQPYYKAGLTKKEVKEVIESIRDSYELRLRATHRGPNISVIGHIKESEVPNVISEIEKMLEEKLIAKTKETQ